MAFGILERPWAMALTYYEVEMKSLIPGIFPGYLGMDRASCGLHEGTSKVCFFFRWMMIAMMIIRGGVATLPCLV